MKLCKMFVMAVGCLMVVGCSLTRPLPQQMEPIRLPPPPACGVACPALPMLEGGSEVEMVLWVYEVIDVAGQCRRLHDECRQAKEE